MEMVSDVNIHEAHNVNKRILDRPFILEKFISFDHCCKMLQIFLIFSVSIFEKNCLMNAVTHIRERVGYKYSIDYWLVIFLGSVLGAFILKSNLKRCKWNVF